MRFLDCRKAMRFSTGEEATEGSWRTVGVGVRRVRLSDFKRGVEGSCGSLMDRVYTAAWGEAYRRPRAIVSGCDGVWERQEELTADAMRSSRTIVAATLGSVLERGLRKEKTRRTNHQGVDLALRKSFGSIRQSKASEAFNRGGRCNFQPRSI